MPTDDEQGSKPLEGSESQMKGALSSRLLRSGMRVVMSDLAVRPSFSSTAMLIVTTLLHSCLFCIPCKLPEKLLQFGVVLHWFLL